MPRRNEMQGAPGDLVLVMCTMYPAESARSRLGLETVKTAVELGHRVVVADASYPQYGAELGKLGASVFPQTKGMGNGKRQAWRDARMAYGSDNSIFCLLESEKVSIVPELMLAAQPVFRDEADVVIPGRSAAAWATHPPEQRGIETFGNLAFQAFTGLPEVLDVWMGPRIVSEEDLVTLIEGNGQFWDAAYTPLVDIIAAGREIVGYGLKNYTYPAEQCAEEMGNPEMFDKRLKQMNVIYEALRQRAKELHLPRPRN